MLACTALVLGVGPAAWISMSSGRVFFSASVSFNERFLPPPATEQLAPHYASSVLERSAMAVADIRALQAKRLLAQQLASADWQSTVDDEPAANGAPEAVSAPSVPIPRARPAEANFTTRTVAMGSASSVPQSDDRSVMQKLSDLFPGRVSLASLAPGGGLFRKGPDLGSLGYDSFTAVYDISARAVYLPDGTTLEAHSGLGDKMDKIEHVGERMVGVTPPGAYSLKPREKLFHGVKAIRLTPTDAENVLGRTGLLVHNYLLGPDGGSNGCVSVKEYERFLKAYEDGQILRLVVVVSLQDSITASKRGASPS